MGMIISGVMLLEMLPFLVMVVMEGCTIALTIWAKTAMTDYDMSPFVFVVYTQALSSIILLLYSFIFHCRYRFWSLSLWSQLVSDSINFCH